MTTSSSRSASTRSGCRPRTRRSRTRSTRASGPTVTSRTCARQLRSMGATFDWDAEVVTADPAYYRWNQWLFLRFLEAGLAYRAKAPVDWCPNDGTARPRAGGGHRPALLALRRAGREARPGAVVPADHEVRRRAAGLHGHRLAGADPDHADELDRPQRRRRGGLPSAPDAHIPGGDEIRVFTTRPDTLFGATFMVLAPEHPLVERLTSPDATRRRGRLRRAGPGARPRSSG